MQFELEYFIAAVFISFLIGAVLFLWQRPKLSFSYWLMAVGGAIIAIYYILHVVFGGGRTGWP